MNCFCPLPFTLLSIFLLWIRHDDLEEATAFLNKIDEENKRNVDEEKAGLLFVFEM